MANNPRAVDNLIPAKKGDVRNPGGKPKGTKHLSTWIQQLLNDEKFETQIQQGYKIVSYKGAPIKAIVQAQMIKAINGDVKAFDALGKYGYGTKMDVTSNGEKLEGLVIVKDDDSPQQVAD